MSLVFPYDLEQMSRPVIPLGGRTSRPRPLVNITMIGPAGALVRQAHIDTGADDTVFRESVALTLGIDLAATPVGSARGVGGTSWALRYALVILRLTDGHEYREWPAWVGFTPARLKRPLLGFAGFLQFFTAAFHGDREQVELTVNPLYPGQ
jgi:hypothetical protein